MLQVSWFPAGAAPGRRGLLLPAMRYAHSIIRLSSATTWPDPPQEGAMVQVAPGLPRVRPLSARSGHMSVTATILYRWQWTATREVETGGAAARQSGPV